MASVIPHSNVYISTSQGFIIMLYLEVENPNKKVFYGEKAYKLIFQIEQNKTRYHKTNHKITR